MNRQNAAFLAIILAVIGGAVFYAQQSGQADFTKTIDKVGKTVTNLGTVTAYTDAGVVVSGEGYEGKIHNALGAINSESISDRPLKVLEQLKGPVWTDAPNLLDGLPEGVSAKSIFDDPDVKAALMESDEAAAARIMREKDAFVLVLHHRIAPSVDRHARVLSRLYHFDHLEYFSLFHVSHGLHYYKVQAAPLQFPEQLALLSAAYLRARLAEEPVPRFPNIESEDGKWDLVATLRGQGQELAVAVSRDQTVQGALNELAQDLERDHRRHVELNGFPPLKEHIKDLTVEIHRITQRAYMEPRKEDVIDFMWEMGIDGAFMLRTFNGKQERGVLPGSSAYSRSIRGSDRFLRHTAKLGRMSEKRPWRDPDTHFEVIRTKHYIHTPNGEIQELYRGVPPKPIEMVTLAETRDAVLRSAEWYKSNIQEDGSVTYKMWPSENRYSNEYNHVRHTLATWNMVQAYHLDPRPEYLDIAEHAQDWTMKHLVEDPENDMAYYSYNNVQKLGSVVVGLLGMVDLARAKKSTEWDEMMKKQGRFVLFMQEDNGKFDGYHVPEDHPYHNQKNDIVPGEAALSLIYLAEYFDDDSWIATLDKYWSYYKPWFYERAKKSDPNAPWPWHVYDNDTRLDLVQFGPWTVMAADAYYRRTGDDSVVDFALEVARWMIDTYEWTEETAPFPDYIGGYYKLPEELPAMQAFCYAEGTAAAYSLALAAGRTEEAAYFEKHTREAVKFGLVMQYDEDSVYPFSRPEEVYGGIRYAMNETKVRIDYVHHGLSAMYQYYMAAQRDPNLPAGVRGDAIAEQAAEQIAEQTATPVDTVEGG